MRGRDRQTPLLVRPPIALPKMSARLTMPICAPGMPGISSDGIPPASRNSISISLSSSSPARKRLRKDSRVAALALRQVR